jgi:hypothetical protein
MLRAASVLYFTIAAAGLPAHAAWVPVDCKARMEEVRLLHKQQGNPDIESSWQNYQAAVRKSQPGSPLYAPFPFSKSDAEIIQNFKYAYFERLFNGTPWERLPSREQPIFKALKENRVRIEVVRVENWSLSRCGSSRPIPFFNLLRLFDPTTGKELARSTQHFTGLMGSYSNVSDRTPGMPGLTQVGAVIRARFGQALPVEEAQYVTVSGLPYCANESPCIAFKAKSKLYLMDGEDLLYEIDAAAPRLSVSAFRQQQGRRLRSLGDVDLENPLVTVGFEWARARLVGGHKRR